MARCILLVLAATFITCSRAQDIQSSKSCLPPNIKQASGGSKYFITNNKVLIPCIAKGDGTLKYTWLKDGSELDLESPDIKDRAYLLLGVGSLNITAGQESDAGIYQCSVTNECGTSLSTKTILKLAQNVPFPPVNEPTELKRIQGSSLMLSCTPPDSAPKAQITWILIDSQASRNYVQITDNNPGFSPVTQNKRVTMDYNGNLYITSVQKEDEQDGKTYVCQAENTFSRSTNRGEDKRISVYDSSSSDMGVDLMWHSNTQTLGLEGKRAKFKCIFSGNPVPDITWTRVTGDIDKSRTTIEDHEMIISNLHYKDAGDYQCMAKNLLSKEYKTHTFTLTVEAAPVWRSTPREVTAGVGESATFECEAYGRPEPTVEWFINGKPYKDVPENPRRVLKDNTLSFTNLEKDDSQVIQCNATNAHGSIWADVYLYVQASPPSIDVPPPEELVVAESQDLRVTCQVSGKPKPRVVWYKGSQALDHEDFEVMENGDLLIKKTEKKHSGTYRCAADNMFGKASATGKVMVRDRTRIDTKPIGDLVDYPKPYTFRCGATTDSMESANLRYRWLKDGVEVKPNERIVINPGELTIIMTSSKDTGSYTCVAENGLDNDTAVATLQVKAVPDPPYGVSVKECQAKRATIVWKFDESMSNFEEMIKFIVEYTTEFRDKVWMEATSLQYPESTATVDLSPYVKYRFRVRAVNLMGTSEPSEVTYSWCETPMAIPEKNPDNVHTDESSTGYLVVKWDPVEQIDHNGPKFQYIVEVQEQGTDHIQTFVVDDYKITEKRIPVENIFRPYYIKVRSSNQVGNTTSEPLTITGFSGEAAPLVVPENFELDPDVNVTATSAGFRWDPVDTSPEQIRGEFSGYKIRFWKIGQEETTLHEHIVQTKPGMRSRRDSKDNKIRGVVANLPSYSEIEAEVVVINKNFESNASNSVNFSTPEGVPGRVEYLEALYRGSHHFMLQWGEPKEQNGIITGYQVSYRKINRLDVEPENIAFEDLSPNERQVTLKNLEPNSQYRIYVRAKTAEGLGAEYFIDVQTVHEISNMSVPMIKHVIPGENDANVTWEIMSTEKGSRYGQLYYMEYMKKNTVEWVRFQQPVEGQTWGLLKHLEPGTQYQVRIVALAHEQGEERPGLSASFTTAGFDAARASFVTAAWFIAMMVIIAVLILILIIVCIVKRNRGDNYPVQEKERLRGNYNDDNQDHFNDYGKGDDNDVRGSGSFDQDAEKVPLDEDIDSLDYGDDDGSKFNEDGSFIGQYGRGEKGSDINASSIV